MMKKRLALLIVCMMACCITCALGEAMLPFYECYNVCVGSISVDVPNAWDVYDASGIAGISGLSFSSPDGGVMLCGYLPAEMTADEANDMVDTMGSLLAEGRMLFRTGKDTPSAAILEKMAVDGLPAYRMDMTGQGFETVYVQDGGDLYYFMMLTDGVSENVRTQMTQMVSSFHVLGETETAPVCREADYLWEERGGNVVVTGYKGEDVRIRVPETLGGMQVTEVGDEAFYETPVRTVILPEGIVHIGNTAFSGCNQLREMALPESLTSIGAGAFESCYHLLEMSIPDQVTELGGSAFWANFFLSSVKLPASLQTIGEAAFAACVNLEQMSLPDENTAFMLRDDGRVLFSRDGKRLYVYAAWQGRERYAVPDGVETVEPFSFQTNPNLVEVSLPDSCKSLGAMAFQGLTELKRLNVPTGLENLGVMDGKAGVGSLGTEGITLCGAAGSSAERYAEKFGYPFETTEGSSEKLMQGV